MRRVIKWQRVPESVYHLGWGITSMADTWQNDSFDGRFRRNGVLQKLCGAYFAYVERRTPQNRETTRSGAL